MGLYVCCKDVLYEFIANESLGQAFKITEAVRRCKSTVSSWVYALRQGSVCGINFYGKCDTWGIHFRLPMTAGHEPELLSTSNLYCSSLGLFETQSISCQCENTNYSICIINMIWQYGMFFTHEHFICFKQAFNHFDFLCFHFNFATFYCQGKLC